MFTRRRSSVLAALAMILVAGCSGGSTDPQSLVKSAGCRQDSDCRLLGSDMVCKEGSCIPKEEQKKATKAAKAPKEQAVPTAKVHIRICPGFWNLEQNTGTLIARNVETGKRHYLRLDEQVPRGGFGEHFTFELPYGKYEVRYLTGVVAAGRKDMMQIKCAVGVECKKGTIRLVTAGPEPSPEEKEALAKKEAEILKKQKYKHGPPCDFDVNL